MGSLTGQLASEDITVRPALTARLRVEARTSLEKQVVLSHLGHAGLQGGPRTDGLLYCI